MSGHALRPLVFVFVPCKKLQLDAVKVNVLGVVGMTLSVNSGCAHSLTLSAWGCRGRCSCRACAGGLIVNARSRRGVLDSFKIGNFISSGACVWANVSPFIQGVLL